MSKTAQFIWKCILYPLGAALGLVVISVLVAALSLAIGTALALPVLLLWNWGLVSAAPLVGVALPTIGLAKAWAVGLSIVLVRMFFTNAHGRNAATDKTVTKAKA